MGIKYSLMWTDTNKFKLLNSKAFFKIGKWGHIWKKLLVVEFDY